MFEQRTVNFGGMAVEYNPNTGDAAVVTALGHREVVPHYLASSLQRFRPLLDVLDDEAINTIASLILCSADARQREIIRTAMIAVDRERQEKEEASA